MDEEMSLIVFAETGHILAGATRTQTAGPEPGIGDYVGEGIMFRDPATGTLLLTVPQDLLGVETVARRDDVLMTARGFQVIDGLPEPQTELTGATPVDLDGTVVTVTLPAATTDPVDCVVLVQGSAGGDPVVQRIRVEGGNDSADEPLPLPSGDYAYLLLVPGFRLRVDVESVP